MSYVFVDQRTGQQHEMLPHQKWSLMQSRLIRSGPRAGQYVAASPGMEQAVIDNLDSTREGLSCDFCSASPVRYLHYAATFDFSVIQEQDHVSAGGWIACPACHQLILKGDAQRLARRSAERLLRRQGVLLSSGEQRMVVQTIVQTQDQFFKERTGKFTTVPEFADASD